MIEIKVTCNVCSHMTFAGKSFIEVTDFVKKVEVVRRDGQAKALAKKPKSTGNIHGSY